MLDINNIHSTVLRVDHLNIGHDGRDLVRDISFELAPGECVLLAGPNGTGKTTLLKRLAGVSGEIPSSVSDLLGMTKGRHSEQRPPCHSDQQSHCHSGQRPPCHSEQRPHCHSERSEGIYTHTVLIPTNIPKVKGFTVEAFVRTGCYRESDWRGRVSKEVERRMEEALKMLGIEELRKRDISTLSDGEFQKACLATGLTRKAEVLLLDEPTAHLDVENRIDVLRTLREVARKTGTAVLFSSHDLHDALQVADRVFVLTRDGRFLASAPVISSEDSPVISSEVEKSKSDTLRAAFPALSLDTL